jgi:hypothetical protein
MLKEDLQKYLDDALNEYSQGDHYETLIEAKNEYFEKTGSLIEEDSDYDSRMNSFNDWYVLQFLSQRQTETVITNYLMKNQIDNEISASLLNVNHSIFEYRGTNFKKNHVLMDILHDEKIIIPKDHDEPPFLEGDIFVGRLIAHENFSMLFKGMCLIPKDIKSVLKKESKKVRKLKNPNEELKFLLQLEYLKTKWKRFGHIDHHKIFIFD